jgi:hypothetical protein
MISFIARYRTAWYQGIGGAIREECLQKRRNSDKWLHFCKSGGSHSDALDPGKYL